MRAGTVLYSHQIPPTRAGPDPQEGLHEDVRRMRPTLGWLWHEQVQGPCFLPLRQREAEGPMSFPVPGVHHQGPPHRAEREPKTAGFGASQPPVQPPGFIQRQLHPGVACTGEAGEDTPK